MQQFWRIVSSIGLGAMLAAPALAAEETEAQRMIQRLMAPPTIAAQAGFHAEVLVPPGHLYDPLFMLPRGDGMWLNDDGGQEKDKGSRLLAIDGKGKIKVLADINKLTPVVGFDVAPEGFGKYGGQIFTVAQAEAGTAAASVNHVIQRINPKKGYDVTVHCTLPELGEGKPSGFGVEARFGPEGSPFADKFYGITALNSTVYQVTADGKCTPFVTLDAEKTGMPFAFTFTPDGKHMLISVAQGGFFAATGGAIVQVSSDGKVADKPLVEAEAPLAGMDFAPEGFGTYGGQLFVAEIGSLQAPVPMTQPLTADGKVHRLTPEGTLELVASGFINPTGVRFHGNTLWVTDIAGDFIAGRRELPDGFLVTLHAREAAAAAEEAAGKEVDQLIAQIMAPPTIAASTGFTAKVLVPPGQLYDPLFFVPRADGAWINDDGPEKGEKGGRIVSVSSNGKVSPLVDIGRLTPVTGFDIAPESFGKFGGQILGVGQAVVKMEGALANHNVQHVDPQKKDASTVVCTLPTAGEVNKGVAGAGVDARFGPDGSPFAGKFFSITAYNNTIYQTTADGTCTPFVTFDNDKFGAPIGLTFAVDGQSMLVTVTRGGLFTPAEGSAIVRISPDGTVEEKPVLEGSTPFGGLDFAPVGFGDYAGQLFVTDLGAFQIPVPMTQALAADGTVHRLTPEGKLEQVASGFVNPMGLRFVGNKLWVADINGDFIGGRRELPDGFVVEIAPK